MSTPYQAPAGDLNAIREICETHGFCLIKNVLDQADLDRLLAGMRTASRAAAGGPMSDLLGLPELRHIYFDPRLLAIARALLGPRLVYDGEGLINFEEAVGAVTLNPFSTLHCDAQGMPDDISAMWSSPTDALYRAYRFGIYFQDYRRASGALKVIVGSHRGAPENYMEAGLFTGGAERHAIGPHAIEIPAVKYPLYNLPSAPGDVVVWNLRTFHSAGAKLFADNPTLAVHPRVEGEISSQAPQLFAPPPGPRNAMFFDYAAPCEEIDLYIKQRARPNTMNFIDRLVRRSDDAEVQKLAAEHGVSLRHDTLITTLALVLASNHDPKPVKKLDPAAARAAGERLYALLGTHEEYSPYFRLFDRARFARAPNRSAAVTAAMEDIVGALLGPSPAS